MFNLYSLALLGFIVLNGVMGVERQDFNGTVLTILGFILCSIGTEIREINKKLKEENTNEDINRK